MDEQNVKFLLKLGIMVLLFFAIYIFIESIGINFNAPQPPKKLIQVVTMEGMESSLLKDKKDAFCENLRGDSNKLNNACNSLTTNKCSSSGCCIWTSENKCVAGTADGAVFNSDSKGKTMNLDYYYYKNKCYGNKCPTQ